VSDLASVQGYAVLTASNGREGIEKAIKGMPGLILMDIMMPEMDGYRATRGLKENPNTARIPVVMLTAVGFELNRALALQTGAVDYITKPFNVGELMEKIEKYLGRPTPAPIAR
jgi:adenylate cyclase